MGGAMDLVASAKNIIVANDAHESKRRIKTFAGMYAAINRVKCVKKIVSDLGVLDITPNGFKLLERARV